MSAVPVLRLAGFKKFYGNHLALDIAALALTPGTYWVKGVNGSGKSTFLKTIAGLLSFKGKILLNDKTDLRADPAGYRKRVNFAEAEPVFPGFLTGEEMLNVFIAAKGTGNAPLSEMKGEMGMTGYLQNRIGTYSSGMLKKLSLLLAFTGEPDLILLDEPLITLDTASLAVLYKWIREARDRNVSFLVTSHQEPGEGSLEGVKEMLVSGGTITATG